MLAEIFLLRLEAALRASSETTQKSNSRFVPVSRSVSPGETAKPRG